MKKGIICFAIATFVLQGCGSSYLKESVNVSNEKKSYSKILVVARTANKTSRVRSEESMVKGLKENGINAVASYSERLTSLLPNEPSKGDADNLIKEILEKNYDGVIVTNLIDSREYTDVIPGSARTGYYPVRYGRFGRFVRTYPVTTWEPDRIQTGVDYVLESCLYDLRDSEGDNLQWVGRFTLRDPSNLQKVTDKYTEELVKALLENSVKP